MVFFLHYCAHFYAFSSRPKDIIYLYMICDIIYSIYFNLFCSFLHIFAQAKAQGSGKACDALKAGVKECLSSYEKK